MQDDESREENFSDAARAPAPTSPNPVQGETQGEEVGSQVEERPDPNQLARIHDDPEQDSGSTDDDVIEDDRERNDPAAYWRAVRTRSSIDHDVGTGYLSPREGAFVIEYTLTPDSAREAAVRAGYAPSGAHVQASRLLRRERVQRAIAREFARKAAASGVDGDYIVRQCRDIAEDHSQKAADRLRAIELIGKVVGAFKPDEVTVNHRGVTWAEIEADNATDADFEDIPDPKSLIPQDI